jgi:hypothetical protein
MTGKNIIVPRSMPDLPIGSIGYSLRPQYLGLLIARKKEEYDGYGWNNGVGCP